LTIKELLTFSAKIRTSLKPDQIEAKVERVIERLGLGNCKDHRIGGWFTRGISGGERKRASMGYELITDPSITLLDEPTSGLDSMTAFRIIEVLRREADRGMGVLCTIHQPSA
jgi:ABC-type multidrug transport system ATPase subunit